MIKKDTLLFLICCLLGGAGWIATPYQIKYVSPEFCVAYRFIAAGIFTLSYSFLFQKEQNMKERSNYVLCAIQGFLLFSINYMLIYLAAKYITSGLLAVTVSLLIIPAMIWRLFLFKKVPKRQEILGVFIGVVGVFFLFLRDLSHSENIFAIIGFLLAFGSTFLSSLGMNLSEKLKEKKVNVILATGYSMLFGGIFSFLFAFLRYRTLSFDYSYEYVWSLGYLIIITFLTFPLYLVLVSRVGAGKASYVWILTPLISLTLSNVYEGYTFTYERLIGAALILTGGLFMKLKSPLLLGKIFSKQ